MQGYGPLIVASVKKHGGKLTATVNAAVASQRKSQRAIAFV
jgi:hypothetical protein